MDDHAPTQPLFLPTPARLPGQVRRLGRFLALGTAGLVALLAGLAWDAVLHARGPGLAAREGVSTLSNPDHLLAGAGVALVAAGLLGALATLATVRRRAPLPAGARAGLGVLAAVLVLGAGVTGAWAAAGHGDGGGAAAAHGQPGQAVAASSGPDGRADHAGAHAIANLPDVAAASDAERARAHALLDASVAATRRYRDPEARPGLPATASPSAGRAACSTRPTRPTATTAGCSTPTVPRRSSTGEARGVAWRSSG